MAASRFADFPGMSTVAGLPLLQFRPIWTRRRLKHFTQPHESRVGTGTALAKE